MSQMLMIPDPSPGHTYNRTAAEQMCEEPGSTKSSRKYSLFNIDQCGVLQESEPSSTEDGDLKPVVKPQKQAGLANNTVLVQTTPIPGPQSSITFVVVCMTKLPSY